MLVRRAREEDAAELARTLRRADLREIEASSGEDPLVVLSRGVAASAPCRAVADGRGRPVALFGVVPDARAPDVGLVWLLASERLAEHPFFVLRRSREWVEELQRRYRVLWNYIDARNELHLRWLLWCGFAPLRRVERHGVEGRPFYEVERVRGAEARRRRPEA